MSKEDKDMRSIAHEASALRKDLKLKLRKSQYAILNKLFATIQDKDIDAFGYSLEELAQKVLNKKYVSYRDKIEAYRILAGYKNEYKKTIIYRRKKYGFAQTGEECQLYYGNQVSNAVGKLKRVKENYSIDAHRLGLPTPDTKKLITSQVIEDL